MPQLLLLFIIPLLASFICFVLPDRKYLKYLANAFSLIPLIILLSSPIDQWLHQEVKYEWIPSLSISFHLNVDELTLLFLYLVAIIIPITLFSVTNEDNLKQVHLFYGFVLLLQALLIGFFTSRDLVLFAVFWESMLFPLYFIISLWGGPKRRLAALKFIIYMIAGSSLMVAAILALYFLNPTNTGTFDFNHLMLIAEKVPYAPLICGIFFLAFAVKTPLFPFHAWLPDAYYQAPTSGTILLSSLLSKAGIYGFLRIGLGFFPTFLTEWSPWLLGLAIAGVLYGGMTAWGQNDYKKLLAYSSFSHVNFVLAGIFIWNQAAHEGAILQAFNHGITIAGLFIVAGWLEERLMSTAIGPYSGVAKYMPKLCWVTLIFILSSVALPGTNNFIGELLILFGLYNYSPLLTILLGLTVILSVIYMLRWMQNVYFQNASPFQHSWVDLKIRELLIVSPLIALIFWIGIYPAPILKRIIPATEITQEIPHQETA